MAADVVEAANAPVVAANGQDRLVQEVEGLVVALLGHVAHVADELPGLLEDGLLLELEEFGIPVDPAGQAEIVLSAEVRGGGAVGLDTRVHC